MTVSREEIQKVLDLAKERSKKRLERLSIEQMIDLLKREGIQEVLKKYPIEIIQDLLPVSLKTNYNEILIKIPETRQPILFIGPIKEKEILEFKKQILLCFDKIKNSSIPYFTRIIQADGVIHMGNRAYLPQDLDIKASASYSPSNKIVYYVKDASLTRNTYITLIHEYGHKFHHMMLKNGFNNEAIIKLYKIATNKVVCELSKMPQIGDHLSNLRENWWVVKTASNDFILDKIDGENYIYVKGSLKKILKKKDILRLIKCPSEYGATDHKEFFSEMCVLITLGLVKPSQKLIADKFMQILEEETI